MNIVLHKHVVTSYKVSYMSRQQAGDNTVPVVLSFSKEQFLKMGSPQRINIYVKEAE